MPRSSEDDTPEDPARRLARQIGAVRAEGAPLEDASWADEALVAALRETIAERDADRQVGPTASQSDRMWQAIEAEMEPASSPSPARRLRPRPSTAWRMLTQPPVRRWAAAVVLLVGAVAAWFVLRPAGPERVAVAEERMRTYTTPGNATVQLRPHSALYRVPVDTVTRYRLRGEAYFAVPARTDATGFEVQTDDARVRVLGTRFAVRTWTGSTEVYLEEGTVRMTARNRAGSALRLGAGQRASVSPDGRVTSPTKARRSVYAGWLDRTLRFERRSLQHIVEELEYHYDLTIRIPERLRRQTLSGQVSLDDRAQSLHDLAVVLGGRFERIDDDTYRFVAQ